MFTKRQLAWANLKEQQNMMPCKQENCCEIFKKATEHRLKSEKENNSRLLFQYGPPISTYEARTPIANYFGKMYKSLRRHFYNIRCYAGHGTLYFN
uniref:Uncharacterized protein n=1 Tax=Glossina palpalis gambiensis TaxID=67801 RepID=A0A1B0BPC7_9MUSC